VDVEIERPPKSLHDGDRAAAPVSHAGVPCPTPVEPEDRSQGSAHDGAAEVVVPGQPVTEAVREAQHPLAHRHPWEDVVDEMGGTLGHAAPTATRAKSPTVAGERHETVEPAPRTPKPGEPSAEGATT